MTLPADPAALADDAEAMRVANIILAPGPFDHQWTPEHRVMARALLRLSAERERLIEQHNRQVDRTCEWAREFAEADTERERLHAALQSIAQMLRL